MLDILRAHNFGKVLGRDIARLLPPSRGALYARAGVRDVCEYIERAIELGLVQDYRRSPDAPHFVRLARGPDEMAEASARTDFNGDMVAPFAGHARAQRRLTSARWRRVCSTR